MIDAFSVGYMSFNTKIAWGGHEMIPFERKSSFNITFRDRDGDVKTITVDGLKEVWVFRLSKSSGLYGLAFSDSKWNKKTVAVNKQKHDLLKLKDKISESRNTLKNITIH